ncbi:MAG: hypothetical protein F6J93_22030 [Oscillatoria sp. SIO1A7]|nr:hypothetical protein [Oscillatoria sp. SIO1A7]
MSPLMLRELWSLIEKTQVKTLLTLDDVSLVQSLSKQFQQNKALKSDEIDMLRAYLQSKLSLIRDMAEGRSFLR